jgi:hypothetical protein
MNFSQDPINTLEILSQKTKPKYFYLLGDALALLVFSGIIACDQGKH